MRIPAMVVGWMMNCIDLCFNCVLFIPLSPLIGVAMIDTETFQSEDYQLVSRCLASYHSVPVPKSQQDQLRLFVK